MLLRIEAYRKYEHLRKLKLLTVICVRLLAKVLTVLSVLAVSFLELELIFERTSALLSPLLKICVSVPLVNLVFLVTQKRPVSRRQTIANALALFLFDDCNYGNFLVIRALRNLSLSSVGRRTNWVALSPSQSNC